MSCPHNLAHNRQTRMLANLSLVSCYKSNAMSSSVRETTLLASAKENIRQMAFFGLTEYQAETQYMFERIFNVRFVRDFSQYKETHAGKVNVTQQQWQEVVSLNKIDVELYRYAKDLFFRRLQEIQKEDMSLRTTNSSISPRNSSLPKTQNWSITTLLFDYWEAGLNGTVSAGMLSNFCKANIKIRKSWLKSPNYLK